MKRKQNQTKKATPRIDENCERHKTKKIRMLGPPHHMLNNPRWPPTQQNHQRQAQWRFCRSRVSLPSLFNGGGRLRGGFVPDGGSLTPSVPPVWLALCLGRKRTVQDMAPIFGMETETTYEPADASSSFLFFSFLLFFALREVADRTGTWLDGSVALAHYWDRGRIPDCVISLQCLSALAFARELMDGWLCVCTDRGSNHLSSLSMMCRFAISWGSDCLIQS